MLYEPTQKPTWTFSKDQRVTLGVKDPEIGFDIPQIMDEPNEADKLRKERICAPKFGTEPRIPMEFYEKTPGPQYYPQLKPEIPKAPAFTLGARRDKKGGVLARETSAPENVGPGRYFPEKMIFTSVHKDFPKFSFPKNQRPDPKVITFTKHQTYDNK